MTLEKVSKLYEVIWSDPSGNQMKFSDLQSVLEDPNIQTMSFLVNTNCFGRILHEDDDTIILSHYLDGNDNTKFKTIPKALVQEVTPYQRNNRVNLHHYWRNGRSTKRRRLVEVDWNAPDEKMSSTKELSNMGLLKRLLVPTMSYGVVAIEDPDVLVLKHYENDLKEREVQIIPQELINRVTPFYSKRE